MKLNKISAKLNKHVTIDYNDVKLKMDRALFDAIRFTMVLYCNQSMQFRLV